MDLMDKINMALRACKVMKGLHTQKMKKMQSHEGTPYSENEEADMGLSKGGEECGYYVMRYMLEVIKLDVVDGFEKVLDLEETHLEEKIDDIQRRWTRVFSLVTSLAK